MYRPRGRGKDYIYNNNNGFTVYIVCTVPRGRGEDYIYNNNNGFTVYIVCTVPRGRGEGRG